MRAVRSLLLATSLMLVACAGTAPLSGPRPSAATVPRLPPPTAPAPAPTAPMPAPIVPAPEPVPKPPSVELSPQSAAAPPPAPTFQASNDRIALVLPLQSPLYGKVAEAVRAGFLAAANAAGSASRVQLIGHGDDGVLPAVAEASSSGVALIVGPLTRDDLKTVLAMAPMRPRMLALNQPDEGVALPGDTYDVALAVEGDAAQLARRAYADGVRKMVAVVSDAPLQRRFANAFIAAWEREGGKAPRLYRFDPNPDVLALLRREVAGQSPDAILLAVGSDEAALAKSFLPPGPVYASSQITDNVSPQMLRDLEGVRYVEIPWLADPSAPAFARLPKSGFDDPVLDRLYALGLDAFALAELLANPVPPQRVEFEGATGHLSLTPSRGFAREGRLMIVHEGQSVAYSSPQ